MLKDESAVVYGLDWSKMKTVVLKQFTVVVESGVDSERSIITGEEEDQVGCLGEQQGESDRSDEALSRTWWVLLT